MKRKRRSLIGRPKYAPAASQKSVTYTGFAGPLAWHPWSGPKSRLPHPSRL